MVADVGSLLCQRFERQAAPVPKMERRRNHRNVSGTNRKILELNYNCRVLSLGEWRLNNNVEPKKFQSLSQQIRAIWAPGEVVDGEVSEANADADIILEGSSVFSSMDLLVLAKKTNVVLSLLVTVAKDVSLRLENYRIALSRKCTDCSDLQSKSVVFGWLQHSLFQFSLEHSFQLQDDVQNRRDDSGPGGHPGPNEGNLK